MTDELTFRAVVELGGKTATGFVVPTDIVEALGGGRRPAVRVRVGTHTYRSTVVARGERFLLPLSAENRTAAGVGAGDEVDVGITLDTDARDVPLPADLAAALDADPVATEAFTALAYTHRKEWVRWIEEAKKPETRERRVASTVQAVRAGKRSR